MAQDAVAQDAVAQHAVTSTGTTTAPDETTWGPRHAHDPTAVRDDDGTWYLFSTDALAGGRPRAGVQVRRSRDLVTWDWHGYALEGVPGPAREWSGAPGLWAPEVVRWGDRFHMYYSASTFGSTRSAIGLAVADRLTGPWEDRGVVVATSPGDGPNAIDANVVLDDDGAPWLVYGSFFAGIHVLPLAPETGTARTPGDLGTCVARRGTDVDTAVEGAYVVRRGPRDYVMILSFDSLFSTYNVRVGRATAVTGPYLDRAGRDLADLSRPDAGTKLLGSHRLGPGRTWLAPGHASVLVDGEGEGSQTFLVHHVRDGDDPTQHEVQVRRLLWTTDGWPVVSPEPFHGEPAGPVVLEELPGRWAVLRFEERSDVVVEAVEVDVRAGDLTLARTAAGNAAAHGLAVRWTLDGVVVDAVAHRSWDHVHERPTVSLTGLPADGHAIMATRLG